MLRVIRRTNLPINYNNPKSIFIIGTGRSGTHLLGYTLTGHPDIRITIEKKPIFQWVTEAALYYDRRSKLLPKIIKYYKKQSIISAPKLYADKSHPNIWLAEDLTAALPNSLFIGIIRNPYATVASMLKHQGVLKWHKEWEKYPLPNEFLGIDNNNLSEYNRMPIAEKCALRWLSHKRQMDKLKKKLNDRILIIKYEDLINNTSSELLRIEDFLELKNKITKPLINRETLNKWKTNLHEEEIEQIRKVTGDHYI